MELKQITGPLLKWWWLILASTLVAILASVYAVSQQAPVYQARTTLMLGQAINNPNPTGTEFYLGQQLTQTYADLAKREPVKQGAMEALGLDWLPTYTVNVVPGTMLIEIKLNDTSPARAMVIANELAKQVILRSPTSARDLEEQERQDFIQAQLDDLEVQIQATKDEIETKQAELAGLFSARQIADLQTEVSGLQAKRTTLQNNYAALLSSSQQGAINSLSVFEPAAVPTQPTGPDEATVVATAGLIGFILGAAAAYLLEFLDDTIKAPEDVSAVADLPTLAGISIYEAEKDDQSAIVTQKMPRSPISEAYRTLRTALLFANVDRSTCTILVTSANPAEGKSTTAANLGVVMAQAGHRVLIIDADLRRPIQHDIFGIHSNNYGLTNLLVKMLVNADSGDPNKDNYALLEGAIHETTQRALYLLTSGSLPPNPAELVGSAKMKSLLETLSELFDYIIIDGPPILAVTDAVVMSTRADSVVLVSYAGSTRRNQLAAAVEQLREVKANLTGVVLNRISAKTSGIYYYTYYSKSYYHGDVAVEADARSTGRRSKKHTPVESGEKKPGLLSRMFGQ